MKLVIDNREKSIIEILSDYNFEVKCLDLGDAVIYDDNDNELILFERKTISDLASSIKDGRYEEQSLRLNGIDLHNHNIFYIIEGDIEKFNTKYSNITHSTLYSCLCSLSFYKGFSVIKTKNAEETCKIITKFLEKITRENKKKSKIRKPYYNTNIINDISNNIIKPEKKYSEVIKRVKKNNITKENIGEIILSQIPGISNQSAISIMNHYKKLDKLLEFFRNDENYKLEQLYIETSNGKKRKINKNISCIIKEYLL